MKTKIISHKEYENEIVITPHAFYEQIIDRNYVFGLCWWKYTIPVVITFPNKAGVHDTAYY